MDLDFNIFQLRVASSLTPNVRLDLNLRAVMAPALHKLIRYSHASVGLHIFVNPEVHEIHVMVVGAAKDTVAALLEEAARRHGAPSDLVPVAGLPDYIRLSWPKNDERDHVFSLFDATAEEQFLPSVGSNRPLYLLMKDIQKTRPEEFRYIKIDHDDSLLILPLCSRDNPRLGFFVLWCPSGSDELLQSYANPRKQEGRVSFRRSLERLVVRLFTNFYRMRAETYLPSYAKPETKNATLLCAKLRDLDQLWALVQRRNAWSGERKSQCMQTLIQRFNETVAMLVRRNNGRIDQIWGDGVLAIFGEYLDSKDSTARPGCRYALQAAGELMEGAREFADDWLKNVFELDEYIQAYAEEVTMSVAIAIHHGEVAFNYVGGEDNLVYIALGNEVSFVKQLVQVEDDKPILLSRTAEFWSREILKDAAGEPSGNVRKPRLISFPGRLEEYPIYPITPANIDLLST